MRRKRTVKPTRFRSAAVVLFFVLSGIAAIAVIAAEWRESVVGVELDVRGLSIVSAEHIREAAGISDTSALSSLDLMKIRGKILENPFIRDVELMRDPPRTLQVVVTERTPLAMLINVHSRDWLLDEDGYVLPASRASADAFTTHDLPVITGANDGLGALEPGVRVLDRRVQKGLKALEEIHTLDAKLLHLFSELSLGHERDLVLYTMEGGVPVILGSAARLSGKMRAFRSFWQNVAMKHDPASLEYIDLRWKEQVVTRWRDADSAPLLSGDAETQDSLVALDSTTVPIIE
ncbi:MAG: cell division protein FtsQ/DivIB [Bacteroidetes bacterium]|nr:cell division protein FtsQ/DivIB [Bacteroidota bacterium]